MLNRQLGLPTPPPQPAWYLPRLASDLDVDDEIRAQAAHYLEMLDEHQYPTGKPPAAVAGACLYAASRERSSNRVSRLSQNDVAAAADVREATIRTHWKALEDRTFGSQQ